MNRIINNLMLRDIKSRVSGDALVYFWGLINPLAWMGAIILCFSLLGKQIPIYTDVISFMIPGMLSYILFRNTIQSILRSKKTSHTLLHISTVSVEAIFTAAALVEFITCVAVYLVLTLLNYLFFDNFECNDLLILLFGFSCAWGTGLVMGLLFSEIVMFSPLLEKMVPLLLRPTFWISGVFYTANELPSWLMDCASWNPLFQSIEIIRDGTFFNYHSRMANYFQPIECMIIIAAISLILRLHRRKLFI